MSNGEREKCHKIHCPNHPAWIPAGQNGCPHCAGLATRGYCVCEMASVDEIRDMYTPPASETPHDDGCGGCDLGICTPSETPSPEVGIGEYEYGVISEFLAAAQRRYETNQYDTQVGAINAELQQHTDRLFAQRLAAAKETK